MILEVSCPSRIDIGNTIDYPNYFFSFPNGTAKTVNIAISLRTKVTYDVTLDSHVEVNIGGVVEKSIKPEDLNKSSYPLVWAAINFFRVNHGKFIIDSEIPRASGLGGSGVLLVALVACILKYQGISIDGKMYDRILEFCHLFENWLGFSLTGFHDQLAAIYGGANLWTWGAFFGQDNFIYQKSKLLNDDDYEFYNKRIILAFSGESHRATKFGNTEYMFDENTRRIWLKISSLTEKFGEALKNKDLQSASEILNEECDIRTQLDPLRITKKTKALINIAKKNNVGSRYVGHGFGGCAWAIGSKREIENTYISWKSILAKWPYAWVIFPNIEERGMIIHER